MYYSRGLLISMFNKTDFITNFNNKENKNPKSIIKPNVLVIGNGWAGKNFADNLSRDKYNITIVDKNNYFLNTHKMAHSVIEPIKYTPQKSYSYNSFLYSSCPFYSELITTNDKYINDTVTLINQTDRTVSLKGNNTLKYDYLVFALGSEINTFGIKGVQENCLFYKTFEDWKKVEQLYNKNIVIIGGGAVGIELAYKLNQNNNKQITIIEAMDILPGFSENTKKLIKKDLESKNILLLNNSKVKEVANNGISEKNNNLFIECDVSIWTGGIKPHTLRPDNKYHYNIFNIGDNSVNKPYTAQKAKQEGKQLANYFNTCFNEKYSLNNFKYNDKGKIIHTNDGLYIEVCDKYTMWLPKIFTPLIDTIIDLI